MHLVHVNEDYASLEEAAGHKDGLAVLGFFFMVSETKGKKPWAVSSLAKCILWTALIFFHTIPFSETK